MNREEILQKSRSEGKDEGVEHAESQGIKIGFALFCMTFLFLALFEFFWGKTQTCFPAINALFWALVTGETIGRYRLFKGKILFLSILASGATCFFSLANYVKLTLR